jgi:hypothetical protein
VDTRREFIDWCVKEDNYNKEELNAFVNQCVERAGRH